MPPSHLPTYLTFYWNHLLNVHIILARCASIPFHVISNVYLAISNLLFGCVCIMQILTFDILSQKLKHTQTSTLSRYLCRYPNWLPFDIKRMSDTYKNVYSVCIYTHVDSTIQYVYVCCLNVSVDFTWFLHKYLHAILSFVKFNNHYCFFGHFVCWFFPSILIYLGPIPCGRST